MRLLQGATSANHRTILGSLISISLVFSFVCYLRNISLLPEGPALAVGEVTKSLVDNGSLTPQSFKDVYQAAADLSKSSQQNVWQDVFALGKSGALLPKHSIFSAVVATPFYFIFGEFGFWLFQQLFFVILIIATFGIVRELSGKELPWSTLIASLFFTPVILHSYGYSFDLHGTSLIVGGLYLTTVRSFWGGVMMAFSIFVRPSYLLLLFPLALIDIRAQKLQISNSLLGVVIVLVFYGFFNYLLWGSPLVTSYGRIPEFIDGQMVISQHPVGFDLNVLLTDWSNKLFGEGGLASYNFSIFLLPLVIRDVFKQKNRKIELYLLLVSLVYTVFIFSYPYWMASFYGNRFLLPAIFLYLFSVIIYLGRFEIWIKNRFQNL